MAKRPETIGDRIHAELRKQKRSFQWLADEFKEKIDPAGVGLTRSAISQWGRKSKPTTPRLEHVRWASTALRVPLTDLLLDEEEQRPRRPFVSPRRVK